MPRPLPAHANALASARVEAWVGRARGASGRYRQIAHGRFRTLADAQAWADAEHPTAPLVTLTTYSAADGWRAHPAGQRIAGTWKETP